MSEPTPNSSDPGPATGIANTAPSAERDPTAAAASPAFGLALTVFAALALIFSRSIESTALGDNRDPGPRALPVALASFLLLGGVVETLRAWCSPRAHRARLQAALQPAGRRRWDRHALDTLLVVIGVTLYVAALDALGFALCTLVLATGLMLRLGARVWAALLTGVGLVTVVQLLFVTLFRVQLPAGRLGLPF